MDMETYREKLIGQLVLIEAARQAFERAGDRTGEYARAAERNHYLTCLLFTYGPDGMPPPSRRDMVNAIAERARQEHEAYIESLCRVLFETP
jgi:hypothetical protein